jgi:hypothetical protein
MKEIAAANTNVPGTDRPMPGARTQGKNFGKSLGAFADAFPQKGGKQ